MSDEAVAFDCPSCGGPLDPHTALNNVVACPYCAKQVIVPESLRKVERGRTTVIQVGSQGSMRIDLGDGDGAADVQTVVIPALETPQKVFKAPRWLSCLVIGFLTLILITTIAAVAAPVLLSGLITREVSKVLPGDGRSIDPEKLVQVGPTIEAALTQVVAPLDLITPTPSFYTTDLAFGESGSGPGMFDDTRWVAVDPQGSLYTVEYQDGRVQKFDPDGSFALLWNVKNKVPLQDIAVSRAGVVYLTLRGEILKFDAATGKALGSVSYPENHYFSALATTADGGLVAISDGETVVRFDASEQVTLTIPDAVSTITEDTEMALRPALDGLSNLYLLATTHEGVFVYSPQGKYLNRIGSKGNAPDQLRAANDIAVDGKGRVYISDIKGVMVFNTSGGYQGLIDVEGSPFGLALDDQNRLYVVTNAPKIYRLTVSDFRK